MYKRVFFFQQLHVFLRRPWVFSCSRLRGTQGARLYTTAQFWVPGGFRGACSGRSKSRNLASTRGVVSREARAEKDMENPHVSHCGIGKQHGNSNRFKLSLVLPLRTLLLCVSGPLLCMCGHGVFVYALCVSSVYVCAGLCMCDACWNSVVACWEGHVHVANAIFIFIYIPERCLHFRPLIAGRASFFAELQALLFLAQLQALLGHSSSSSSSTSTSKSADPQQQQQHQQLECVACRSLCSMFPPAYAVPKLYPCLSCVCYYTCARV